MNWDYLDLFASLLSPFSINMILPLLRSINYLLHYVLYCPFCSFHTLQVLHPCFSSEANLSFLQKLHEEQETLASQAIQVQERAGLGKLKFTTTAQNNQCHHRNDAMPLAHVSEEYHYAVMLRLANLVLYSSHSLFEHTLVQSWSHN